MAAEGDAVEVVGLAGEKGLGDLVGDENPAHCRVRAGQALGEGDHVRRVVEALSAEPGAEAPESADDLVGEEKNPVALRDLAEALPIAGGGDDRTARVLHRLHDDHRNRLRLLEPDHGLDLVEERPRKCGLVATSGGMPVRVRGRDV